MKKKREAKRQAKLQDSGDSNNDKQDTNKKIDESIDNEKKLRIKKIQSVCSLFINYIVINFYHQYKTTKFNFLFTGFKKYQSFQNFTIIRKRIRQQSNGKIKT